MSSPLKSSPLVPTTNQLRWQNDQFGIFFHFGINTYANAEWSDGTFAPSLFNPTDLDVDSWLAHAASWDAKYAILTAKHHDGFCLWPSSTTDYSVASSPWHDGRGDLVGEFVDACRRHGVRPGLYLSPWDRHAPEYDEPAAYRDVYLTQLTELCTGYGALTELWFDGAGSEGYVYDWASIMQVIDEHQPGAMVFNMGRPTIRWVGNEDGLAGESTWYPTSLLDSSQYTDDVTRLDREVYLPPECDVSIRLGWFWHADEQPKNLEHLLAIHERSIGRGANLLLNVPPTRAGLLDERDIARMDEFADALRADRDTRRDAKTRRVGEGMWEARFDPPLRANRIWLSEDLSAGQHVRSHQVLDGDGQILSEATTIGSQRLHLIGEWEVSLLHIRVDDGQVASVSAELSPRSGWSSLPIERASTERPVTATDDRS